MKTKKHIKSRRNHLQEFSKIIIVVMSLMWILAGLFLIWVVYYQIKNTITPEYVSAEVVCTYFMAPVTAGLVGYFCKAAFENKEKIKGNSGNSAKNKEQSENTTVVKG